MRHTDNVGKREKNVELSLRRADAGCDYLIAQGVEGGRVTAKGYGPDQRSPTTPPRRAGNGTVASSSRARRSNAVAVLKRRVAVLYLLGGGRSVGEG
jgi:outer membrane protein OmpA-like peptidoglycan-associated protein